MDPKADNIYTVGAGLLQIESGSCAYKPYQMNQIIVRSIWNPRSSYKPAQFDMPIWLIVWYVWVCDESHIGYLLDRFGLY